MKTWKLYIVISLTLLFATVSLLSCVPLEEPILRNGCDIDTGNSGVVGLGKARIVWHALPIEEWEDFAYYAVYRGFDSNVDHITGELVAVINEPSPTEGSDEVVCYDPYDPQNPPADFAENPEDYELLPNRPIYYRVYTFFSDGSNRASNNLEVIPYPKKALFIPCIFPGDPQIYLHIYEVFEGSSDISLYSIDILNAEANTFNFQGIAWDDKSLWLIDQSHIGTPLEQPTAIQLNPDELWKRARELAIPGSNKTKGLGFDGNNRLWFWTALSNQDFLMRSIDIVSGNPGPSHPIDEEENGNGCTTDRSQTFYNLMTNGDISTYHLNGSELEAFSPDGLDDGRGITSNPSGSTQFILDRVSVDTDVVKIFRRSNPSSVTASNIHYNRSEIVPLGIAFAELSNYKTEE